MEKESAFSNYGAIDEPFSNLARSENPLLSDDHIRMLRLIGRGTPREEIESAFPLTSTKFHKELMAVYEILGVSSRTAAVQKAITLRVLTTEELVDRNYDWRLFNYLNDTQISILGAFITAENEDLTDEEFNALNIKTSQAPKKFISKSMRTICETLGLSDKTTIVVYYRAFKEKEQNTGGEGIVVKPVLTAIEVRYLELTMQGLTDSVIGRRLLESGKSAYEIKKRVLAKLGTSVINEALLKAEEMSILPKKINRGL